MADPPPNPLPPNVNIGPTLSITAWVFVFPTVITTILRLWVRIREKLLGSDDFTIIISTLLSIVLCALSIQAVHDGKGRHVYYLSNEQKMDINRLSWVNQIVLFCAICFIKTSICLLILRIKNTTKTQIFMYGTIAGLAITNLIPIIALLVECTPVYRFWDRTAARGHCRSPDFRIYSIYVQSAYSILTDLTCSIAPTIIVWHLQLSIRKKIGVCILMSMGLVCTAFAALRATSLGTNISDTTYTYVYSGTWATIETSLGIIAANLAPLRAIILKFFPRLISRATGRQYDRGEDTAMPTHLTDATYRAGPPSHDMSTKRTRTRRTSSFTSDRSEIPLKQVGRSKNVPVDYSAEESGEIYGRAMGNHWRD